MADFHHTRPVPLLVRHSALENGLGRVVSPVCVRFSQTILPEDRWIGILAWNVH